METLSRVKKYEELRKQIEDNTIEIEENPQKKLQDYAHRMNDIDPSIFKKVKISDEEPYIPERERKVSSSYDSLEDTTSEFRNEYLDDFINEVREYNIRKGNRENENTQIDILNQLQAVSPSRRSNYVEIIQDDEDMMDTTSLSKEEIAAQVQSLLADDKQIVLDDDMQMESEADIRASLFARKQFIREGDEEQGVVEPFVDDHAIMKDKIAQPVDEEDNGETKLLQKPAFAGMAEAVKPLMDPVEPKQSAAVETPVIEKVIKNRHKEIEEDPKEIEREEKLQQKLVEETQQLRVQLNEYEDDLNDLSEGVEKTNKLLNVILGCLILALLVIIGIIVYWIMQAGGVM